MPVVGDWLGDGTSLPGLVRAGQWFYATSIVNPYTQWSFRFGWPDDAPLVVDHDGDGVQTPGGRACNAAYRSGKDVVIMTDLNRATASLTPSQGGGVLPRRFELFDQLLGLFPPGAVVDLGAGHGMFSLRAAQAGWSVTAVDARPDRFPRDSSVKWLTQDVRKVDLGPYDVIACLGLFYHLTPKDQVSLLRRAAGKPIIIDTHVANEQNTHRLSERVTVDGYEGSWYREPGELTSSWGNRRSFWPTPESLYRMLKHCGYPVIMATQPWVKADRTFFLALPPGYVSSRPGRFKVIRKVEKPARTLAHYARHLAGRAKRRLARAVNARSAV